MDRLIYSSLTAMRSAMARQQVTANNLANASTPGFRADMAEASSVWLTGDGLDSRAMSNERVITADMRAGPLSQTGRDLDIACQDDAMLAVQAADGSEAYTRRGDLQISPSGLLTTGDGAPVLGEGGPIVMPPSDKISFDENGGIWIVPPGGDPQTPQRIDRLKLVSPAGSDIEKGMDGLFREVNGGALPSDPDAAIVTRTLEGSNVSTTEMLVEMIEASRNWETQLKMISSAGELDGSSADLMRLPS